MRIGASGARRLPPLQAAIAAALVFAGCAAGPDFQRPAPPSVSAYTAGPMPAETAAAPAGGGASQRFVAGGEIPAQWWSLFRSGPLDLVIRRAFAQNPTLAAAQARLLEAQEVRQAQFGALLPQVDAAATAGRRKSTGSAFGRPGAGAFAFTLYGASVNVSYALDLFGRRRRELEALTAEVDYRRYQLEGAWLALSANIVTTAVREAAARARIAATEEIVAAEEEQLALVEKRFALGAASRTEVLAQQAQLAETRAALPALRKELSLARHRLATLAGAFPAEAESLPAFELDRLVLPEELPVSVPSSLARRRPDIRAAEEILNAASARVGAATADLYPQVTLTAGFGSEASRAGDLFGAGSSVWNLGAGLLQPLFRGGELAARRRAASAAFDEARALYRETVLQAFQEVADVLRALEADAETLRARAAAEAAARASLALARTQFELGAASYLTLLNAQRQHRQARIALDEARAARFADTAALFQALGGGWGSDKS